MEVWGFYNVASVLYKEGKYHEALDFFIKSGDQSIDTLYNMALCYFELKELDNVLGIIDTIL